MKFVPFKNDVVAPQDSTKIGTSRLGSFRIGSFRLGSFRETPPKDSKAGRRSDNKMSTGHDSEDESYESCNTRFISNTVEPGEEVTTRHAEPVVSPVLLRKPSNNSKPHKSNDMGWEAIQALRARDGTVGLSHFKLLRRLGCGDIGSVYLCELRGTDCYFAMKDSADSDDVQEKKGRKGKEVVADGTANSPPKTRPAGEKRKRATEVQKLIETSGGEQKTNRSKKEKVVYTRKEKASAAAQQVVTTEKGSDVAVEKQTRQKGSKQKKFKNPAVVAKDITEAEMWKVVSQHDRDTAVTGGQKEEAPSQRGRITKGSVVEIMGVGEGEDAMVVGVGKVINLEGSNFHGVPIPEGMATVEVTKSNDDDYLLYEPVNMDDPPITNMGQTVKNYILWPLECLNQAVELA